MSAPLCAVHAGPRPPARLGPSKGETPLVWICVTLILNGTRPQKSLLGSSSGHFSCSFSFRVGPVAANRWLCLWQFVGWGSGLRAAVFREDAGGSWQALAHGVLVSPGSHASLSPSVDGWGDSLQSRLSARHSVDWNSV